MIDKLKLIMKDITLEKCKGVMRSLQFKDKELHSFILNKCKEYNNKNTTQTIYWLVNNITQKPICIRCNKREATWYNYLEGYDTMCGNCSAYVRSRETMKERYGVESPAHMEGYKDKIGKHERHNHKEKCQKSLEEKYGSIENFFEQRKEKVKQANLEKFGETHYLKTQEGKDRVRKNLQEKYGAEVTNVMHLKEVREKVSNSYRNEEFLNYVKNYIDGKGFNLLSEYKNALSNLKIKCKKCGTIIETIWNNFQQNEHFSCKICNPLQGIRSWDELEIYKYVKENLSFSDAINGAKIFQNEKTELDIYIPSINKAIEYCGLRYHSSGGFNAPGGTDPNYHLNKLNKCKEKNIRLITIFEDEFILKKKVVFSKIKLFLGNDIDIIKIRAEECELKIISFDEKSNFLEKYHLQGDKISTINIGLFSNNLLVSVMTFSKIFDKINIYCLFY